MDRLYRVVIDRMQNKIKIAYISRGKKNICMLPSYKVIKNEIKSSECYCEKTK